MYFARESLFSSWVRTSLKKDETIVVYTLFGLLGGLEDVSMEMNEFECLR
jgi:hypothetical protein